MLFLTRHFLLKLFGPFSLRAIEESEQYVILEKNEAGPGGTQSGGKRKTRNTGDHASKRQTMTWE